MHIDRRCYALRAAILCLATILSACSSNPPQTDFMNTIDNVEITATELRLRLYDFANNFTGAVETTAAAIELEANDPEVTRRSLQWRLGTSTAVFQGAFMQDPLGAFLDVWGFAKQMRNFLSGGAGSELFGTWQALAVTTARQMDDQARELAQYASESGEVDWIDGQLELWAEEHPLQDLRFIRQSTLPQWSELAVSSSSDALSSVGRMEVSMQELLTRTDILVYQMQKRMGWEIRLLRDETLAEKEIADFLLEFEVMTEDVGQVRLLLNDLEPILERQVAALFDSLNAFTAQEKADLVTTWAEERAVLLAELNTLREAIFGDLQDASAGVILEVDAYGQHLATADDSVPRRLIDHLVWRLAQLLGIGVLILALLVAGAWWFWRRQAGAHPDGR